MAKSRRIKKESNLFIFNEGSEEFDKEVSDITGKIFPSKGNFYSYLDEREALYNNEPLFFTGITFDDMAMLYLTNNKHSKDNMYDKV